jgi:hypothetical protein
MLSTLSNEMAKTLSKKKKEMAKTFSCYAKDHFSCRNARFH